MLGGQRPFGEQRNPFRAEFWQLLNEVGAAAAKFLEIEPDLQRVILETSPPAAGAQDLPLFKGIIGDAFNSPDDLFTAPSQSYRWWYDWNEATIPQTITAGFALQDVDFLYDVNPLGKHNGFPYFRALNWEEVLNGPALAVNGVHVGQVSNPTATVTPQPLPLGTPAWFWLEPAQWESAPGSGQFTTVYRTYFIGITNALEVVC